MRASPAERFSERAEKLFLAVLPSPLAIALLLTVFAFCMALIFTGSATDSVWEQSVKVRQYWYDGLWSMPMLAFTVQTMLMLILGHTLALSPLVSGAIDFVTSRYCDTNARAALTVTLLTVLVGLFNWGLGLVFGAIFARKVAENAVIKGIAINYPLIGAAGFSGLLVWHGGISGISLLKAAEPGHLRGLMPADSPFREAVPEFLTFADTIFSKMNITVDICLIVVLPLAMHLLAKYTKTNVPKLSLHPVKPSELGRPVGAEKMDRSAWVGTAVGLSALLIASEKAWNHPMAAQLGFIDPNWINLTLLGAAVLMHRNLWDFGNAVDQAIGGAAGILIQFPLYFGIMGIMTGSGLVQLMSDFFVSISTETSYPVFTFLSAGLVNVFVPSGGGQWAIQGAIIVRSAAELGVSLPKAILAMAYGDQLTNMMQPFWALPLLGITGLKAKEILPYTLFLMMLAGVIFTAALLLF